MARGKVIQQDGNQEQTVTAIKVIHTDPMPTLHVDLQHDERSGMFWVSCTNHLCCSTPAVISSPDREAYSTCIATDLHMQIPQPNTLLPGALTLALLLRLRLMSQVQQHRSHSKEETAVECLRPAQAGRVIRPSWPTVQNLHGQGSGTDLYRTSGHSVPLYKCS